MIPTPISKLLWPFDKCEFNFTLAEKKLLINQALQAYNSKRVEDTVGCLDLSVKF